MNNLEKSIFDLRVHALYRIACREKIKTDVDTIRSLATKMSDSDVIRSLRNKQMKGWWTRTYWGF